VFVKKCEGRWNLPVYYWYPRPSKTNPALYLIGGLAAIYFPLLSPPDFQQGGVMATPGTLIETYEAGYLDTRQTLELFAELLRTGAIWHLRYSVRRTGEDLLAAGYLTPDGQITDKGRALIFESMIDEGREGSPCDANPEIDEASGEPIPGPFAVPDV